MSGPTLLEKKLQSLGLESTPEEFVESLPAPVQRRVEALQELQTKHDEVETQFRKERAELEAKYEKLYAPLYADRTAIVSGEKEVPLKEGDAPAEVTGVPEFWLTVMLKSDVTADLIKDKDIEILQYLTNITSESLLAEDGAPRGFKLFFHFSENPFFSNTVLEKTYLMMTDDEGVLEKAEGTKIDWKAGKDVTIKIMKKKPKKGAKPDAKPQIKTEKVDSFFNFFSPPDVPAEDDEMEEEQMEELQALIEADYEVGATIKEKLIPHAVHWYTGEAIDEDPFGEMGGFDDEDDDEDDDDEGDEDDDEDDDDDEDEGAPKQKGKKKGAAGAGGPEDKPPECKQQ
uniref:Nucleosome assembly protein n=1 Tax=Dunaliella tertiolecta TaxID=3047 RepID=A0A7S3VJL0_DUNTE|mmetsp:Transcript_3803/g.8812  ORF Transcript_3803/g.8812 Transcript_3803/m.8812 type:complete len:343 (+) Transcript_3803:188-1216(+)